MSEREILETIATLARERLFLDRSPSELEIRPEMRLVEDLGLDSLNQQALAIEVENHFRICLDERDEEGIATVADLVRVIDRKLAGES